LSSAIITFVKNPEKGKVKTRLASTLGDDQAFEIYLKLLEHTRSTLLKTEITRYLYYSKFIDKKDPWSNTDFEKRVQNQSPDLGDRMNVAFKEVLQNHDQVIIIGSDCPLISNQIIDDAIKALKENDVVVGPALDGGYYLLGMNKHFPDLFKNIAWSQDSVFRDTIFNATKNELSYQILETLPDIDYEADWVKYGW